MDRAKMYFTLIHIELLALERYQQSVEGYFKDGAKEIEAQMDCITVDQFDEVKPHPDYVDLLVEDYREFAKEFPNHFRASFLIQITSFIENELKRICFLHYEHYNPNFNSETDEVTFLKDFKISTYMDYLKSSNHIDFDKIKSAWDFINSIYKVRNIFTHYSGFLRKGRLHCSLVL